METDVDLWIWEPARRFVIAGDTRMFVEQAQGVLADPPLARQLFQRLLFVFSDYANEPRELYEMPEVRAWMRKLDGELPWLLYFVNPEHYYLYLACQPQAEPGGLTVPGVVLYLQQHAEAIDGLCSRIGDDPGRVSERLGRSLLEHLTGEAG